MMDLKTRLFIKPTLDALELKKEKGADYVIGWKSKVVFISKFKPLYITFLNSIKLFEYRTKIKRDKDPLAVEQNNYLSKTVNVYIIYDLDVWPKVPLRNFTLKTCLFGATNTIKNSDKENYVYSGYGIGFDGKGE